MAFNGSTEEEKEWKNPGEAKINQLIEERITGGSDSLDFYDGVTHNFLMSLSKSVRKSLKNDTRIMTKDNPIFMY